MNRYAIDLPKIGIRPCIDGRRNGVREGLEDQTMNMARTAAKLIRDNLRYPNGDPVANAAISLSLRAQQLSMVEGELRYADMRKLRGVWLAVLLLRSRGNEVPPGLRLQADEDRLVLRIDKRWLHDRPLLRADLEAEPEDMLGLGIQLKLAID